MEGYRLFRKDRPGRPGVAHSVRAAGVPGAGDG